MACNRQEEAVAEAALAASAAMASSGPRCPSRASVDLFATQRDNDVDDDDEDLDADDQSVTGLSFSRVADLEAV